MTDFPNSSATDSDPNKVGGGDSGFAVRFVPGQALPPMAGYEIGLLGMGVEEYFISGTATSFTAPDENLGPDGQWTVSADQTAPFETRAIVLRPNNPDRFSGTVIVEWMNVSAGMDAAPDWSVTHREVARSGHAYVAVSCQIVGVEGGPNMSTGMPLKKMNAERYASLNHPGDAFSYDIFSNVARLLRAPNASGLLGPLQPHRILAIGESQSATFLVTYINAVDPIAKAFDGFLIHSRGTSVGHLSGQSIFVGERKVGVRLREDLRVPTILVETETDLLALGGLAVRQPDTDKLRTWEIAGAAHADNYLIAVGGIDSGIAPLEAIAAAYEPISNLMGTELAKPINFAPQQHYVTQTALHRLEQWMRTGEAPPTAPPLEIDPKDPSQLARDDNGNAIGGLRTPWADVPTACNTGVGAPGTMSYLFGSSAPFDDEKLAELYPAGPSQYLEMFAQSLDRTIEAGFLLPADRAEIIELASLCYRGGR